MSSYQVLDPDEPYYFDPTVTVLVQDLESDDRRKRSYSALRQSLRDTDELVLVSPDGTETVGAVADLLTSGPLKELRVTPLAPDAAGRSIVGARAIVARLRGPGGCPWDREQTPETLIRFVLEDRKSVV